MSKTVMLKVTSAFLVGGDVARSGEVVEVTTAEAKDLLHRGKAVLATAADEPTKQSTEAEQDAEAGDQADGDEPAAKPASKARKAK